jgi:hypothetical protein
MSRNARVFYGVLATGAAVWLAVSGIHERNYLRLILPLTLLASVLTRRVLRNRPAGQSVPGMIIAGVFAVATVMMLGAAGHELFTRRPYHDQLAAALFASCLFMGPYAVLLIIGLRRMRKAGLALPSHPILNDGDIIPDR